VGKVEATVAGMAAGSCIAEDKTLQPVYTPADPGTTILLPGAVAHATGMQ